MHRHAPGPAVRIRTFAPLAVTAGGLVTLRASTADAAGSTADAAGSTVTETITSAYRTGR